MILHMPDGARINIQFQICPRIHERVKVGASVFTVSDVIHVLENNGNQSIQIHLISA